MDAALRVGLMVPANNTTMERELVAWLPAGASCMTLRIPRGKGALTLADIPAYVAHATMLAKAFADEPIDIVVYGCTAAGILAGPRRDAEIAASLARVTGKPVVTTAGAMVDSLHHAGAQEVALVTPYQDLVNEQLKAFLAASGIHVRKLASFGAASTEELAAISAGQVAGLARQTMDDDCDALFIACSQLPTYAILGGLAQEFGRPVLSSIQASAWRARQELGLVASRSGGRNEQE
jgi:maleate cis-trans isomerase